MKITPQEVEHVAKLARLALDDAEREMFTRQLSDILAYVDKLNELDTSRVTPTSHVIPVQNVFRPDEVGESLPVEEALANSPAPEHNHHRVPKIVE
ncbi:MAG TPA: Asp-tRNA(Asn)/Glu-tRNA(Gln) amidotransferase subunit GatC [bacterium]|nr:Asp-tRNA(Asn)/Glu-tRNA(Gln) amidotransferase subunit GatC [bacterium]